MCLVHSFDLIMEVVGHWLLKMMVEMTETLEEAVVKHQMEIPFLLIMEEVEW